jgi:hypothetical protein
MYPCPSCLSRAKDISAASTDGLLQRRSQLDPRQTKRQLGVKGSGEECPETEVAARCRTGSSRRRQIILAKNVVLTANSLCALRESWVQLPRLRRIFFSPDCGGSAPGRTFIACAGLRTLRVATVFWCSSLALGRIFWKFLRV